MAIRDFAWQLAMAFFDFCFCGTVDLFDTKHSQSFMREPAGQRRARRLTGERQRRHDVTRAFHLHFCCSSLSLPTAVSTGTHTCLGTESQCCAYTPQPFPPIYRVMLALSSSTVLFLLVNSFVAGQHASYSFATTSNTNRISVSNSAAAGNPGRRIAGPASAVHAAVNSNPLIGAQMAAKRRSVNGNTAVRPHSSRNNNMNGLKQTATALSADGESSDSSNNDSNAAAKVPRGGDGATNDTLKVALGAVPTIGALAGLTYAITTLLAPQTSPAAMSAKLVFAGAVAGIISRTLCAPIEMVSTVMMCRGDACVSMRDELSRTWKAEGLRGMFKGNGANCLKVAPSRGTQFLVYEFVKKMLVSRNLGMDVAKNSLHAGSRLFAGGVAGMVAATIVYPLEVVKTMLTLYPEECTSIPGALKKVFRTGGVGALYRGLGPTLVAMFPYVGVEFMVYETLKKRWEAAFGPAGTVALLILGALGGAAAQASAHPLDVIRRRMQMQSINKRKGGDDDTKVATKPYSNMFSGLYRVGKDEGWHVLFNGLGPACLEKIPSTAFGYYIYEGMKVALGIASV